MNEATMLDYRDINLSLPVFATDPLVGAGLPPGTGGPVSTGRVRMVITDWVSAAGW